MENGHLKLGIANVGVVVIALFSALNTFFAYFLFRAITTTPTLAMPNFKWPFAIETNASGKGIGVVLT